MFELTSRAIPLCMFGMGETMTLRYDISLPLGHVPHSISASNSRGVEETNET